MVRLILGIPKPTATMMEAHPMTGLFGKPYEPSLIDLDKYEGDLWRWKAAGISLMPVPPIPGLRDRAWSLAEMQAMQINRREAEGIFARVDAAQIVLGKPLATDIQRAGEEPI